MRGTLLLVTATLLLSGCVHVRARPEIAYLKVVAVPDTASVYVNDRYVGRARVLAVSPKAMKPGIKYVTFEADDYFPHDVRLDLPPGTTTIRMKLRRIPP